MPNTNESPNRLKEVGLPISLVEGDYRRPNGWSQESATFKKKSDAPPILAHGGGMESLSFDGLEDLYEDTRTMNDRAFASALRFIHESFPTDTPFKLLEPGIGTGRIAIPLAQLGYQVTGVDISGKMLNVLARRMREDSALQALSVQRADFLRLPFRDGAFDLTLVVHVFYFIRDWKGAARELLRVTRQHGAAILMHTGTGTELPFLNERYRALCALQDAPVSLPGAQTTKEVVDYLCSLGCRVNWVRDQWRWSERISLRRGLDFIRRRAYSFTAHVDERIHHAVIRRMEQELMEEYASLETLIEIPNQIYLAIIRIP